MIVNGREVKFMRTMGANAEIADLAPDGDMTKLGEMLQGFSGEAIRTTAKFICALNNGYIGNRKFVEPDYSIKPLTPPEVLSLPEKDYLDLVHEALEAYTSEVPKIETEPVPVAGKKTAGGAKPKK